MWSRAPEVVRENETALLQASLDAVFGPPTTAANDEWREVGLFDFCGRCMFRAGNETLYGVGTAVVGKSTLPDDAVNTCIATAVGRWRFPAAAAMTKVSYPFELSPAQ